MALYGLPLTLWADTLTFEQQFFTQEFFSGGNDFQGTVVDVDFAPLVDEAGFPQFDPLMGTLQRVDVTLRGAGIIDVQVHSLVDFTRGLDWGYSLLFQLNLTDPLIAPVSEAVSASQAHVGLVTVDARQSTIVDSFVFNENEVFSLGSQALASLNVR